ncbi:MAG TPA: dihydrofolate reductase family protein [Cyclobacteriaceae bacterium]|nr:dihydrofolate reductase family protein [Cyclobacteriaceae bacterium]HRK54067.1 dihydrofolate reductase family protein [Cyclobacteriaceae bacterium]
MRKIVALSFISLDGVIQAPGGPEEDLSGGFRYGGWVVPYMDEVGDKFMQKLMEPSDLLLGRKTYDIWTDYWPKHADNWKGINDVKKYVLSTTVKTSDWQNSFFLENVEDIKKLKKSEGSDIKVWGSSKLVQLLLQNALIDELWLLIYPLVLGEGKKMFADGAFPTAYILAESFVTPSGVVIVNYK